MCVRMRCNGLHTWKMNSTLNTYILLLNYYKVHYVVIVYIEYKNNMKSMLLNKQNGDKSKRRHRNGDRIGYIQNGDKPKQHLQFWRLYNRPKAVHIHVYDMQLLSYMIKVQYSIARNAWR